MGKLKTKKGVAKRFKLTKKRKIICHSGGKSHLATSKETKKVRHMKKGKVFSTSKELMYLKRMLPYG